MSILVVLLRVGIDSASGGIQGPLFPDRTFEYVPIPDSHGLDERTYGNTVGRTGRRLVDYFPARLRTTHAATPMHVDPEFDTFTYGDPTTPKRSLRRLDRGDLLVFYAGLQPWSAEHGSAGPAGLYIIGYFEVQQAGWAREFDDDDLGRLFSRNAHVRHPAILDEQRQRLLLVKGGDRSRLLTRAAPISEIGVDRAGRPLKVISEPMRAVFGDFGGQNSIQRSPPRWVDTAHIDTAAEFVRALI